MDDIIACGIAEINEKGVSFTMADLAARMSVSKSTLYAHFASKDDLIEAIIERTIDDIVKQDRDILENKHYGIIDKIRELLNYQPQSALILDNRLFLSIKRAYPKAWDKLLAFRKQKLQAIILLIEAGVKQGYFREVDLVVLQVILESTIDAFFDQQFLLINRMSFKQAVSKMTDIIFKGLVLPLKNQ